LPDLLADAGQASLMLCDQLRLKVAVAVARRADLNRPVVGQQRLRRATAVAGVPCATGRRLAGRIAQMLGQLL